MTDPTIDWCPPTTNCFPFGGTADEWAVDYWHGNPFPTVDPFCPAFAPAGVSAQMATHCGADTGFSPLPAAFPPSLAGPACLPPPTILNCPLLPGPPPTFFICPAPALAQTAGPPTHITTGCPSPQAHASPDTTFTLPPGCFGAAPMAHTLPSLPQTVCAASPASPQSAACPPYVFPTTPDFGCVPTSILVGCLPPTLDPNSCPTTPYVGCPVPTDNSCAQPHIAQGGSGSAMAVTMLPFPNGCATAACIVTDGGVHPAAALRATPSTFAALIDCGPTLGSPCTHPTQAGPACGTALMTSPAATIPPVCAPPTLANCQAVGSYPTFMDIPTVLFQQCNPAHIAAAAAPQTAYFFCIQPSVNFCPPPSNVQCPPVMAAAASPNTGSYSPRTYDSSCGSPPFHPLCMPGFPTSNPPYYTKPSICAPPTMSLECLG